MAYSLVWHTQRRLPVRRRVRTVPSDLGVRAQIPQPLLPTTTNKSCKVNTRFAVSPRAGRGGPLSFIVFVVDPGVVKTGAYKYEDGTRYVGEWSAKGQKHGMGHLALPDGTRYDGALIAGLCSGLGVMAFPDGAK
ncbi:MORN repeat-containing protein 4 homolog [Eumeta japonica]|uniref:MORN repeat-containing protein 4 homolog n=1 Tax=Eumeta variegata TaxID=151549 RepID=A0A4C1VPK7_EUMVA|nr:MORN repeat-containing protein 4 homolog [Eumeta japonica]